MVAGIRKDTIDDVLTVISAVLIFNTLPSFRIVGTYFQQYPTIILIIGIALIAFRQKIAEKIGE